MVSLLDLHHCWASSPDLIFSSSTSGSQEVWEESLPTIFMLTDNQSNLLLFYTWYTNTIFFIFAQAHVHCFNKTLFCFTNKTLLSIIRLC